MNIYLTLFAAVLMPLLIHLLLDVFSLLMQFVYLMLVQKCLLSLDLMNLIDVWSCHGDYYDLAIDDAYDHAIVIYLLSDIHHESFFAFVF